MIRVRTDFAHFVKVFGVISRNGFTLEEISTELNTSKRTAYRWVEKLKNQGFQIRITGAKKGQTTRYYLESIPEDLKNSINRIYEKINA